MTRVTSQSKPLFQSVRVRLRFANTHIIRFSSGSLFAILKNTVRVRLRFDKNSVKPVYKTPIRVRCDSLLKTLSIASSFTAKSPLTNKPVENRKIEG